jgi:putative oxidoreductase
MGSAWGLLVLRAVVGLVFFVHGAQKLFGFGLAGTAGFLGGLGIPLPTVAAGGLIAVELLGGLALLLGAWTRVVAALLAVDMLVAMLTVHLRGGFFVPDGVEFVLTLLGTCLALIGLGAGPWSIDAARGGPLRYPEARGASGGASGR